MKRVLLSSMALALIGMNCSSLNAQTAQVTLNEKSIGIDVNSNNTHSNNVVDKISGTAIWGAQATVGVAEGEFSAAFTQASTFTAGDNPTGWTALSENESAGAVTPGNAYWTRSLTGESQGAYWGAATAPISSPSQANGVALFDSDYLDNNGVAGAFGTGISPSNHRGSIISPRIDVTGYTDSALVVEFYSYYREYIINELSASFSTDDGTTWTNIDYRAYQASQTNGFASVVFPTATAAVPNLSQCRIKFTFDGDYYFAMVDDVTLGVAAEYDLTIAVANDGGNTLADAFFEAQVTNNRFFPVSQLGSNQFHIGANVKNFGFGDVFSADSAKILVEIQKDQGGSWIAVHNQVITVDTINSAAGTTFTDVLSSTSWLVEGDFRTRYVTSLSADANASNDTLYHYFTLNDNSYASKVSIDTVNNKPTSTRQIFPGGTNFQSFEYGSMFEFNDALGAGLEMDSASFRYYVPNGYTGPATATIFVNIYFYEDGTAGGVSDGVLDASDVELLYLGIGLANITVAANGTYANAVATSFVDPATGNPMSPLQDGYYLVSLLNNPSLTGGGPTFDSNTSIWFGASEQKNYSINAALTDLAPNIVAHPSPVKVVDGAGTGDWNWVGFGADMVPSIGLHLSAACVASNSTDVRTECDSLVWIDGNTYTANNNVASYTMVGGASNGCDSVVSLDLTIEMTASGTDTQIVCDSLVWIDGTTYLANNNVATHTLVGASASGCDSVVTLDLTVSTVNTVVVDASPTFFSQANGATYQWVDCDNSNAPIAGATNQSFTATATGNYAVEVTENGCTSTSSCFNVTLSGINSTTLDAITVAPNPTTGNFIIANPTSETIAYTVSTLNGKIVTQDISNASNINVELSNMAHGVYLLQMKANDTIKVLKVVKL